MEHIDDFTRIVDLLASSPGPVLTVWAIWFFTFRVWPFLSGPGFEWYKEQRKRQNDALEFAVQALGDLRDAAAGVIERYLSPDFKPAKRTGEGEKLVKHDNSGLY